MGSSGFPGREAGDQRQSIELTHEGGPFHLYHAHHSKHLPLYEITSHITASSLYPSHHSLQLPLEKYKHHPKTQNNHMKPTNPAHNLPQPHNQKPTNTPTPIIPHTIPTNAPPAHLCAPPANTPPAYPVEFPLVLISPVSVFPGTLGPKPDMIRPPSPGTGAAVVSGA